MHPFASAANSINFVESLPFSEKERSLEMSLVGKIP
jgi:hypothetical protein